MTTVFKKGFIDSVGDCGKFSAAIDVDEWGARIEVYGDTYNDAEQLRDRVFDSMNGMSGPTIDILTMKPGGRPTFNGNNITLVLTINTLLDLDEKGIVTHRLPGLGRQLLAASAERLIIAEKRGALFKKFMEFVEAAPVGSDVCCCGESMTLTDHGDHTPVDVWDNSARTWLKELNEAFGE